MLDLINFFALFSILILLLLALFLEVSKKIIYIRIRFYRFHFQLLSFSAF